MAQTLIISKLQLKKANSLGVNNEDLFVALMLAIASYYVLHHGLLAVFIASFYLFWHLEISDNLTIGQIICNFLIYQLLGGIHEVQF